MKKMFLAAMCLVMIVSCDQTGNQKQNDSQNEIDSLQTIINQKNDEVNSLMNTFTQIQDGFNQINEAEGRINMLKNNSENNNAADVIKENLEFIQTTMAENKRLIEELQAKAKESSIVSTKLKEAIQKLTQQLEDKNKEIENLQAQLAEKDIEINNLGATVTNLTEENNEVKASNESYKKLTDNQDAQLNTAWFVYGTSKELKEHKILVKGDVLENEDFDKDYFTKIDIRKTTSIPLGSKYAKMYTTHPAGSYSLLKDSNGEYTLRISDPAKFWSVSKYLVIRVK